MAQTPPVLIVDDDDDLRNAFAQTISDRGYHVETASGGVEALALLRGGLRPGLTFVDLMMPQMDGDAFHAELRADPALRDLPLVFVSAGQTIRKQTHRNGVPVLGKPFKIDDLFELVRRFVGPPPP